MFLSSFETSKKYKQAHDLLTFVAFKSNKNIGFLILFISFAFRLLISYPSLTPGTNLKGLPQSVDY